MGVIRLLLRVEEVVVGGLIKKLCSNIRRERNCEEAFIQHSIPLQSQFFTDQLY